MKRTVMIGLAAVLAAGAALTPQAARAADDAWQKVAKMDFGGEQEAVKAIHAEVEGAAPDKRPALEAQCIAILNSPDATMPGKQFACRMLRYVGSPKCVPAAARLLTDEKLSHMARWALEGIADPAAEEALLTAMKTTKGAVRIGIIETVGERGDAKALAMLSALIYDKDAATANAALKAIAAIGGQAGADVLAKIATTKTTRAMWCDAALTCAGDLAEAGKKDQAAKIFEAVFDGKENPSAARAAALGSLIEARKLDAMALILKALKSGDRRVAQAAAGPMIQMKGAEATAAFAKELPGLPETGQIMVLNVLGARGDMAAGAAVAKMVGSDNAAVRGAAISALATCGDASCVGVLAEALATPDREQTELARRSLIQMRGEGVVEAIMGAAAKGEAASRKVMFEVLAERKASQALPLCYQAAAGEDGELRTVAVRAIGVLGGPGDVAKLTDMLLKAKDGRRQAGELAAALRTVAVRIRQADPVVAALAKADAGTKPRLLEILGAVQGDKALSAIKAELASSDAEVKRAAVSALKGWNSGAPMEDLLKIAKGDDDAVCRVLALQGYVNMIGKQRKAEQKLAGCRTALDLATRPQEKMQALAVLSGVKSIKALELCKKYLSDPAVKREALAACGAIAVDIAKKHPEQAFPILERVVKESKDRRLVDRARRAMGKK